MGSPSALAARKLRQRRRPTTGGRCARRSRSRGTAGPAARWPRPPRPRGREAQVAAVARAGRRLGGGARRGPARRGRAAAGRASRSTGIAARRSASVALGNSSMPEWTRNALQPSAPAARSAGQLARVARHDAAPEADVDVQLARARRAASASSAARVVVTGMQLSGMSTSVVTPPAAAARVAVSKPSHSVRPGSLMCTWLSTSPGVTTRSPTSSTPRARRPAPSLASRRDRALDAPSSMRRRRGRTTPSAGSRRRRPRSTHRPLTSPQAAPAPRPLHQNSASAKPRRLVEVRLAVLDEERARDAADQARDRVLHPGDAGPAEAEAQAGRRTCSCRGAQVRRRARHALGELEARAQVRVAQQVLVRSRSRAAW